MVHVIAPERPVRAAGAGVSFALGAKIINQPLAMPEALAGHILRAIEKETFDPSVLGNFASKFIGTRDYSNRYRVTEDGVALVPVSGMLVDRGDWLGDLGGFATSYEGLAEQFRRLAKDSAIKKVVLDIDSGGGMVAGLWDLCAEIGKLKKAKKVYAVAANFAASAAYAIGCMAHEFYVSRSGVAGSIGVIMIHQSYQRLLDAAGVDTTIIAAGEHKADGNPYTQLGHGARAEFAAEIEAVNDGFIAHVAKYRGLEADSVRALQARVYSGGRAVDAGLADGVKSVEDLLEYLREGGPSASRERQTHNRGGRAMPGQHSPAADARPDYDAIIAATVAALNYTQRQAEANTAATVAPVAAPAAQAPAAAQVPAPAAADSKSRIKAIMQCEAAKTRRGLAEHLALETDIDPAMAQSILEKTPAEAAASEGEGMGASLARAMSQPGASAQVRPEGASGASQAPSLAARVAAKYQPQTAKRRA